MKRVHLIFPNISSLAEFVIKYKIKWAEVNSTECRLSAFLSDEELIIASKEFEAEPKKIYIHTFSQ